MTQKAVADMASGGGSEARAAARSRWATFATQAHALLLKNLSFQRRNARTNAAIAAFPALVCALLAATQSAVDGELGRSPFRCGCGEMGCGVRYSTPVQALTCAERSPARWPALVQVPGTEARALTHVHPQRCGASENCPAAVLLTGQNRHLAEGLGRALFPRVPVEYYLVPGALNSLDYSEWFSRVVLGSSTLPARVLFMEPALVPDETLYVLQDLCLWNSSRLSVMSDGMPLQYDIQCVQALPLWCDNSSVINRRLFKGYKGGNKRRISNEFVAGYDFIDTSMRGLQVYIWYNSTFSRDDEDDSMTVLRVPRLVNMASTAYLKLLLGADVEMHLEYLKEMPKPETRMRLDLTILFNALFFTWIVQLLLPMHGFENSRNANMLAIQKRTSLASAGLDIFRLNSYRVQFIFYFTYINLQAVLSFLFASFFSSVKTASVITCIYVFGSGLLGDALLLYFIQDSTFPKHWIIIMELFPAFSLYRGIYDLAGYAYEGRNMGKARMQWVDLTDPLNGMKDVLVLMSVEWIILLPLAFILDHRPAWHPLSLFRFLLAKNLSHSQRINEVNSASGRVSIDFAKPDVLLECKVVKQLLEKMDMRSMFICHNLKKVYAGKNGNPDKIVVRGLSLALRKGQCFGMLGPSGSRKTSFINMMIGLVMPTSGTAYIDGMNLKTDMNEIYANIGVCPQHDLLWESLTGREHLLFYGQMKNLTGISLKKAVEESLKSVNLFHSGFGDNSVVYMDELSTGLDPMSRIDLWNVIKQAKKDYTIILTTHSMEEAEELCDRIGIFIDGEFHCIGTPNELKARYGGTRTLTIMTDPKHKGEVDKLVNQLSPSTYRFYSMSGTQKFVLPHREVGLDDVFRVVETLRRAFPVLGWGLTDATLEDVFIRVVKEAQAIDDMS
ncbi:unnamed protein product [Urochloa decumbens]|uniref:ABC transporter domain-containing protein n=1 Tax=Urochloa decumbens TaxID=240449 RepID=A0ABC9C246_9POAL